MCVCVTGDEVQNKFACGIMFGLNLDEMLPRVRRDLVSVLSRRALSAIARPAVFDACVIGGGVVGAAVCRELTLQGYTCLLAERGPHLAGGASAGNTGIACSASDVEVGTLEHGCLMEGTALNVETYRALNLPHRASGSVYCAYTEAEREQLEADCERRLARGDDVEMLSAKGVRARAPAASSSLVGGLWIKGEVVVDPWLIPIAWARRGCQWRSNPSPSS